MDHKTKLIQDVRRFLEVYRFLPSEGKAHFEAELAGNLKKMDASTQQLYKSLLQSAKMGQGVEEAIAALTRLSPSL